MPPSAFDLLVEGARTLRARLGLHLAAMFAIVVPPMLVHIFVIGDHSADMGDLYRAILANDPAAIQAASARVQGASGVSYLVLAFTLVGYEFFTALSTRAALETHRGRSPSFVECVRTSWYAIPWLLALDVPATVLIYVGVACCCVPGITLALLFAAYLSFVPTVLVEERANLFVAWSRSVALSRGQRGVQVSLAVVFVMAIVAISVVAVAITMALVSSTSGGTLLDSIGPAVHNYVLASRWLGWLFWVLVALYLHARVAAYVHRMRQATAPEIAAVFR